MHAAAVHACMPCMRVLTSLQGSVLAVLVSHLWSPYMLLTLQAGCLHDCRCDVDMICDCWIRDCWIPSTPPCSTLVILQYQTLSWLIWQRGRASMALVPVNEPTLIVFVLDLSLFVFVPGAQHVSNRTCCWQWLISTSFGLCSVT
jgi:hypothetical protein